MGKRLEAAAGTLTSPAVMEKVTGNQSYSVIVLRNYTSRFGGDAAVSQTFAVHSSVATAHISQECPSQGG